MSTMASHPIFGATRIPRYVQLAELLRQRVERGEWAFGALLPSIDRLMEQFDVARVTVRQAIALLEQEGLLSPQRGRGTFVIAPPVARRSLHVETTLADLVHTYRDDSPDHATLAHDFAAPRLRPGEGAPAPGYVHMRRIHAREGEPYCVIALYIDRRIYDRAPQRFASELVLPVLVSIPGLNLKSGRQILTIGKADVETANHLGVPVNTPMAEVRRILTDAEGVVVYLAEVSYRGDSITLEMDLKV